jgi:phosphoribosylformylglycinamidine (FGAM) synthase PurS component
MPAISTVTINDGEATPVAHAFSPVTTDGSVAKLAERVGVPIGFPTLIVSSRSPVGNGEMYKAKLSISIPETVVDGDGRTALDYTNSVHIEFVMHERSLEQERKNLRVLAANLLANAAVITVVEKLEPMY